MEASDQYVPVFTQIEPGVYATPGPDGTFIYASDPQMSSLIPSASPSSAPRSSQLIAGVSNTTLLVGAAAVLALLAMTSGRRR